MKQSNAVTIFFLYVILGILVPTYLLQMYGIHNEITSEFAVTSYIIGLIIGVVFASITIRYAWNKSERVMNLDKCKFSQKRIQLISILIRIFLIIIILGLIYPVYLLGTTDRVIVGAQVYIYGLALGYVFMIMCFRFERVIISLHNFFKPSDR